MIFQATLLLLLCLHLFASIAVMLFGGLLFEVIGVRHLVRRHPVRVFSSHHLLLNRPRRVLGLHLGHPAAGRVCQIDPATIVRVRQAWKVAERRTHRKTARGGSPQRRTHSLACCRLPPKFRTFSPERHPRASHRRRASAGWCPESVTRAERLGELSVGRAFQTRLYRTWMP